MGKETNIPIGLAADHGGYTLKERVKSYLQDAHYQVTDYGADRLNDNDDYPDYVIPLARAVAKGKVARGIAICGSGVGACVAANKVAGARAAVVHEVFSAHQGVEDDDMNILCLGERVIGQELALELIHTFLEAEFSGAERHRRRLSKIKTIENKR